MTECVLMTHPHVGILLKLALAALAKFDRAREENVAKAKCSSTNSPLTKANGNWKFKPLRQLIATFCSVLNPLINYWNRDNSTDKTDEHG